MSDIRVELIRDLGPARQHGRTRYAPRHSPGRQRGTDGVRRPPAHTRGCRTPTRREGTERARSRHGAGTEGAHCGTHTPQPHGRPLPCVCRREAAAPRRDHASTPGVWEPRFGVKEGLRVLLHGPGWRLPAASDAPRPGAPLHPVHLQPRLTAMPLWASIRFLVVLWLCR